MGITIFEEVKTYTSQEIQIRSELLVTFERLFSYRAHYSGQSTNKYIMRNFVITFMTVKGFGLPIHNTKRGKSKLSRKDDAALSRQSGYRSA